MFESQLQLHSFVVPDFVWKPKEKKTKKKNQNTPEYKVPAHFQWWELKKAKLKSISKLYLSLVTLKMRG